MRIEADIPAGIVFDEAVHASRSLLPSWIGVGYLDRGAIAVHYPDPGPAPATITAWQSAIGALNPATIQSPRRNGEAVAVGLAQAMAGLQTIIDTADFGAGTLTGAQLSNHVRTLQSAVKLEARALRRLVRIVLGDLTGSA